MALSISDHLDWDNVQVHLQALEDKLNRYLAFIESGELVQKYPNARGRSVVIDVYFKHEPSRQAVEFLREVGVIVRGAGVSFGWCVLPV